MKYTSKKNKSQEGQIENNSLPILFPDTAGIDIGSRSHFVAVPSGRDPNPVREFLTFTADLHAAADWLQRCQVDSVAWNPRVCTGYRSFSYSRREDSESSSSMPGMSRMCPGARQM